MICVNAAEEDELGEDDTEYHENQASCQKVDEAGVELSLDFPVSTGDQERLEEEETECQCPGSPADQSSCTDAASCEGMAALGAAAIHVVGSRGHDGGAGQTATAPTTPETAFGGVMPQRVCLEPRPPPERRCILGYVRPFACSGSRAGTRVRSGGASPLRQSSCHGAARQGLAFVRTESLGAGPRESSPPPRGGIA